MRADWKRFTSLHFTSCISYAFCSSVVCPRMFFMKSPGPPPQFVSHMLSPHGGGMLLPRIESEYSASSIKPSQWSTFPLTSLHSATWSLLQWVAFCVPYLSILRMLSHPISSSWATESSSSFTLPLKDVLQALHAPPSYYVM